MQTKQLDVLFVHPNASSTVYQSLATDFSAIETPIWAAMLTTRARRDGFSAKLLDCEALGYTATEAAEVIAALRPNLIAIVVYGQQPSASTQNMVGAEELYDALIAYIGSTMMHQRILFIGAHPSALPSRTIADNIKAFVCQGEGPETIKALIPILNQSWDDGYYFGGGQDRDLSNVPGLYWQKEGVIHSNPPAPLLKNLDTGLPGVDWSDINLNLYRTSNWHAFSNKNNRTPFASIYTSLGCPYHCTFCMINAPFGGSSFRFWSPEHIIRDFDYLANAGISNIKIADEMFVLNKNHFMKLCELLVDRKHDFNIWAYARVDTVKKSYLETLKKAGVNWLALGIESGNKAVRGDVIKGKFEDLSITNIVKEIQDHGINVIGNFIFGLPEDNHETMRESLDLAKSLNLEMANFYSAMAYPGSKLFTEALKNKTELPKTWAGYSQHSKECHPLATKHISSKEVLEFRDKAFIEFFSDPAYQNRVMQKFGSPQMNDIKEMLKHRLVRDILNDKEVPSLP